MPYKRRRSNSVFLTRNLRRRKMGGYKTKRYPRRKLKSPFARKVMKVVNRAAETKSVMVTMPANVQLTHNTIHLINNNVFYSKIGSAGEQFQPSGSGARVGKRIFVKGIKLAIHIENQQYRPYIKYQLLLLRCKPESNYLLENKSDIYEGISTTIPLDYIDTDKVDVMWSKNIVVKAPNVGTTLTAGPAGVFDHGEVEGILPDLYEGINTVSTNPRYMAKLYIPVNKQITYNDFASGASELPVNYRYQLVMWGYDNRTTPTGSTTWPIGHVNASTKMIFTDV